MDTTTIGIFEKRADADAAISELRALGIADTDISYIYTAEEGGETVEVGNQAGEGAASGATTGAVLGAIAGLAVANGLLPGFGSLFVAGPIAAALGLTGVAATTAAGAMTGLAAGGLVGALAGLGVPDVEARVYEEKVRRGGILLTAKSLNPAAVKDVFKKYGAAEIREYAKTL
ncbi:general stress protein [Candidatus Parcubacteria bacterium]|nr:general stress protein [Candidatus Parcubacteria bacterium]